MTNGRTQPHPEYTEVIEVHMDGLVPGQAPVVCFHHPGPDPRRVVATIPESAHSMLYLGRLVGVEYGEGDLRKGCIEAIDGRFALIRAVDWDD